MTQARHIRLSHGHSRRVRLLAGIASLPGDDKTTSWVTVTRTGSFTDPRYGRFDITRDMLLSMVKNFEAGTVGTDIFLDVAHKPADGSAAKILALRVEGDRLRAQVEWTPFGIEAVKQRGYQYLSAEYHENYQDNKRGQSHGPVLLGAGLTVRPVIKRLAPITLSCDSDGDPTPVLIHPEPARTLLSETQTTMNTHPKKLQQDLQAKGLSEAAVAAILKAAEEAIKLAADDDAVCARLRRA
ncbi:phage protease [Jeongeupia sp. HS-3]|uniref:phage protease n=1 Tax=Jeongeupia sp. HS-3 TaxID=1009682 RepID=UPI0019106212|nr:phage protease [Jeongeupia sp. HS-3]